MARAPMNVAGLINALAPMDEREASLARLEQSWADFMRHARTGANIRTGKTSASVGAIGLLALREELEKTRERVNRRDGAAAWQALLLCARHNVPMPYWLADAVIGMDVRMREVPASLHTLMGLNADLPVGGKQASKARVRAVWQRALWQAVKELQAESPELKDTPAVEMARRALPDFPYGRTEAIRMFRAQAEKQAAAAAPLARGKRVRKLGASS